MNLRAEVTNEALVADQYGYYPAVLGVVTDEADLASLTKALTNAKVVYDLKKERLQGLVFEGETSFVGLACKALWLEGSTVWARLKPVGANYEALHAFLTSESPKVFGLQLDGVRPVPTLAWVSE